MKLKTGRRLPITAPANNFPGRAGASALLLLLLLIGSGCQSVGFFDRAMPKISGRVLAGDTGRPLAGVTVLRLQPGQIAGNPAKGAELLLRGRPEITGADGCFVMAGREYVSFFNRAGGWSVRLAFQAEHYAPFTTNYTMTGSASNSLPGEPLVQAGDILMKPLPK